MKRNVRTIVGTTMAAVMLVGTMSFSTISYAGTTKKKVTGYGTLTGSVSGTIVAGSLKTSVTKNNDNAKLTIKLDFENKAGVKKNKVPRTYSLKGATSLSGKYKFADKDVTVVYGAHGVQNGTKYGAEVVYTYTEL